MSDSEQEVKHDRKKAKAAKQHIEYAIQPEKGEASVDTSSWPLLLKVKSNPIACFRGQIKRS